MKGKFIVIEGIDGCGKTTLANNTVDKLKEDGYKAEYFKFPVYASASGITIKKMLMKEVPMDKELFANLTILNRLEAAPIIRKKLEEGINIICDRYIYSEVVYSCIRNEKNTVIAQMMIQSKIEKLGSLIPNPDKVIFITTDVDLTVELLKARNSQIEEYEKRDILILASRYFNAVFEYMKYNRENVVQIRATKVFLRPLIDITNDAVNYVSKCLNKE